MHNATNPENFVGLEISGTARGFFACLVLVLVFAGVVGNALLIIVLVKGFRRQKGAHYLFIGNLAIGDLLTTGYWLPFFVLDMIFGYHPVLNQAHCMANSIIIGVAWLDDVSALWQTIRATPYQSGSSQEGDIYDGYIKAYAKSLFTGEVLKYVQVCLMSLMSISLNRWLHVCFSTLYKRLYSLSRIFIWCLMIWILATMLCIPLMLNPHSLYFNPEIHVCSVSSQESSLRSIVQGMILFFSVVGLLLVGVWNFGIFRSWKKARLSFRNRYPMFNEKKLRLSRKESHKSTTKFTGTIDNDVNVWDVDTTTDMKQGSESNLEECDDSEQNDVDRLNDQTSGSHSLTDGKGTSSRFSRSSMADNVGYHQEYQEESDEFSSSSAEPVSQKHVELVIAGEVHPVSAENGRVDSTPIAEACLGAQVNFKMNTHTPAHQPGDPQARTEVGKQEFSEPGKADHPNTLNGTDLVASSIELQHGEDQTAGNLKTKQSESSVLTQLPSDHRLNRGRPSKSTSQFGEEIDMISREPSFAELSHGHTADEGKTLSIHKKHSQSRKTADSPQQRSRRQNRNQDPVMQTLQNKLRKNKRSKRAFIMSLFVVFILMCLSLIPYGIISVISRFSRVPTEVSILGTIVLFFNNSFNWLVYGVMNPTFRKGYTRNFQLLVLCCQRKFRQ